jgi:hypothetical protein
MQNTRAATNKKEKATAAGSRRTWMTTRAGTTTQAPWSEHERRLDEPPRSLLRRNSRPRTGLDVDAISL